MTPDALATLHAAAFANDRPWQAAEFETLLSSPYCRLHTLPHGFALTRTVADESELLTLAVDPDHRRRGIASALMQGWMASLEGQVRHAFLEVASDNDGAIALYRGFGFDVTGRRRGYYRRADAEDADALTMCRNLTLR